MSGGHMKNFLFALLIFLLPTFAVAQTATQTVSPIPSWVLDLLTYLQALPTVGPVLVTALNVLAVVAVVMTALAGCLQAVVTALAGVSSLAGAETVAQKLLGWYNDIEPYLKYFSMFNVQKTPVTPSVTNPPNTNAP